MGRRVYHHPFQFPRDQTHRRLVLISEVLGPSREAHIFACVFFRNAPSNYERLYLCYKKVQYLPDYNISNWHFVITSLDPAGLTSKSENFPSRAAQKWSCARHDPRSSSDPESDSNDFNVNRSNIPLFARNHPCAPRVACRPCLPNGLISD